jgi:AcrR family transcriptional regulator
MGQREQTKAANRAAILGAGRAVFSEIGYGATTVRDIVRRTDLAAGTFYNYFPDKEALFRALLEETATDVRRRVRAARLSATTLEEFVSAGFRAYYSFLAEDRETFQLMRRNAGTVRALFDEPALGAGFVELREDLDGAVAAGRVPLHDTELMARAMVGAAFEVGVWMVERDPPDVEQAVEFVTQLFVAALEQWRSSPQLQPG